MIPSNTYQVVGTTTIAGIMHRSGLEKNNFYAIEGFALQELLVLAARMDWSFNDGDEKRDWQNRINGIVDAARRNGVLT